MGSGPEQLIQQSLLMHQALRPPCQVLYCQVQVLYCRCQVLYCQVQVLYCQKQPKPGPKPQQQKGARETCVPAHTQICGKSTHALQHSSIQAVQDGAAWQCGWVGLEGTGLEGTGPGGTGGQAAGVPLRARPHLPVLAGGLG
jgi:hypothetical protein